MVWCAEALSVGFSRSIGKLFCLRILYIDVKFWFRRVWGSYLTLDEQFCGELKWDDFYNNPPGMGQRMNCSRWTVRPSNERASHIYELSNHPHSQLRKNVNTLRPKWVSGRSRVSPVRALTSRQFQVVVAEQLNSNLSGFGVRLYIYIPLRHFGLRLALDDRRRVNRSSIDTLRR